MATLREKPQRCLGSKTLSSRSESLAFPSMSASLRVRLIALAASRQLRAPARIAALTRLKSEFSEALTSDRSIEIAGEVRTATIMLLPMIQGRDVREAFIRRGRLFA